MTSRPSNAASKPAEQISPMTTSPTWRRTRRRRSQSLPRRLQPAAEGQVGIPGHHRSGHLRCGVGPIGRNTECRTRAIRSRDARNIRAREPERRQGHLSRLARRHRFRIGGTQLCLEGGSDGTERLRSKVARRRRDCRRPQGHPRRSDLCAALHDIGDARLRQANRKAHLDDAPADAGNGQPAKPISPRQRDVLTCIRRGLSNKEIARELDIAEGTVKIHLAALFSHFGARNRTNWQQKADAFRLAVSRTSARSRRDAAYGSAICARCPDRRASGSQETDPRWRWQSRHVPSSRSSEQSVQLPRPSRRHP